jgi:hypothetical protein
MLPWSAALGLVVLTTTWMAQPIGSDGETPFEAQLMRLACAADDGAELEVTSAEPFPVRNALTELQIGDVSTSFSRYGDDGDLHTLIFSLTRDQLLAVSADEIAVVRYNPSNGHDVWLVGPIDPGACQTDAAQLLGLTVRLSD